MEEKQPYLGKLRSPWSLTTFNVLGWSSKWRVWDPPKKYTSNLKGQCWWHVGFPPPPQKKLSLIGSREFSPHLEPTNRPKKIHLNFRAIPSEKPCMLNELHFLILKKPFGRKQKGKEHVDQEYDIPFTLSILTPQNWLWWRPIQPCYSNPSIGGSNDP